MLTGIPPLSWLKASLLESRHSIYALQKQVRILNAEVGAARYPDRMRELLVFLRPQKVVGFNKIRLGSKGDGGYVMIDDFSGIKHAYSLGIDKNVSWDLEMAQKGIKVAQFDYSIPGSPASHPNFTFLPKRVEKVSDINLQPGNKQILKIDIEGSEREFFANASSEELSHFSQIMGEFHNLDYYHVTEWWEVTRRVFQNLNKTHQLIHIHSNNSVGTFWTGKSDLPMTMELTYVLRSEYQFEETRESFPGEFDFPNHPDLPEHSLDAILV